MKELLPQKLQYLAKITPRSLYVVGGCVRDYLSHLTTARRDIDICSPMSADVFSEAAKKAGFTVSAIYRNTGTVKLDDGEGNEYEYTSFRTDQYVRGTHTPVSVFFTDDIMLDAKRRDFTCNAVYYDIAADKFVDPLGGIAAIEEKRISTVDNADKVFGEDGLRLMRLARQSAQLGFMPDAQCLAGARKNAELIKDISPERIFTELTNTLYADQKYGIEGAQYNGLKLLQRIGVLNYILPELTLGECMTQRNDYHAYDVLEHSFRAVRYADKRIRWAALLHDVGKPYCMARDGNFHQHPTESARIADEILTRLKSSKRLKSKVHLLVFYHMYDFNCLAKENKLRRFFILHPDIFGDLLLLKQADFSACKNDLSIAPTVQKWTELMEKMKEEKVPFTAKQLAVSGRDVIAAGVPPKFTAAVLREFLLHTAIYPEKNEKEHLLSLVPACLKTVQEAAEKKNAENEEEANANSAALKTTEIPKTAKIPAKAEIAKSPEISEGADNSRGLNDAPTRADGTPIDFSAN